MEQQSAEGVKPKLSRCAAKHLRRKRLNASRREALKNSQPELGTGDKVQTTVLNQQISESAVNLENSNSKSISQVNTCNVQHENIKTNKKRKDVSKIDNKVNEKSESNKNNDLLGCNSELSENKLIENTRIETKDTEKCLEKSSDSTVSNNSSFIKSVSANNVSSSTNMSSQEKSREQIKAEREAKKAAKAAAKSKGKVKDKVEDEPATQLKKTAKSKTDEKEKISLENKENKTVSSDLPLSTKQTVAHSEVTKEKKIIDDKEKLEESKKSEAKEKTEEKSKAELRAERRAKQEAQRAVKQASLTEKKKPIKVIVEKKQEKSAGVTVTLIRKKEPAKKIVIKTEIKDNPHEVNLFKHLYINRNNISQLINRSNVNIHPEIIRLGVQYAEKVIVGSNARCVALLAAIKQLIRDFERPSQADFTRGLEISLQESVNYLNFCRPPAVSMQNALKHLKWQMSTIPSTLPDEEAKLKLANAIDTYIQEQILLADKAISNAIQKKILNGDVILTYGFSSLIHKILCDAYTAGKQFRVVVVDGRPWLEGRELVRRLVKHGIDCSYILINALSFIMPQVSKVFLGAHAILANGAVMSRVGTAQVALIANAFNVPVLVACETHKSCERVQTDSIVYNEIGDPDQLVKNEYSNSKKSCLSNWKTRKTLNLLNITYDVTPADLVTAVVTELAILPCTSVPVILRIKPSEI